MRTASNDSTLSAPALLGCALLLILIWGSAFTMVGVGVDYLRPIWLVAYRLVIGAAFITAYVFIKGHRFPGLSDGRWVWYGCLGLTGSIIPFFLIAVGQQTVDSGLSAILVGIMPLMTIIMAHVFTDEKLNIQKFIGFLIGFAGIILLFLPENFSVGLVQNWEAQALIVSAAFFYAITTVGAKRAPDTPSSVGGAIMMMSAAIAGLIGGCLTGIPENPPLMGHLMAWGLGIGSTGIATILYLYVIEKTGPSLMARINYFVPVASVGFGVWLLDEVFEWRMAVSFVIIILGVMISRMGERRAKALDPSGPQTGY